jgi:hypothetical protein
MMGHSFLPSALVGRQGELHQVSQILSNDGDLLLAGVPGIGRRTLIRAAAKQCGIKVIEIDCLRATNAGRFLELLAEAVLNSFDTPAELQLIQAWSKNQPFTLEPGQSKLVWHSPAEKEWFLFQKLLSLPQTLAEKLNCRVVVMFENFPHLRSWDRGTKWEDYLRSEIQQQSRVSYALIATVAECWADPVDLQVISLAPLPDKDLQAWLVQTMTEAGLQFDSDSSIAMFLNYVQGHFGDAIALARRVWLDVNVSSPNALIQTQHVYRSAIALIDDLSVTFESLILLLPNSQVRVLESLALDPTDSPHAREYIKKHNLSRGGGLQGALASLEQKGLVYGAEQRYQIAIPLLGFWLKYRLG